MLKPRIQIPIEGLIRTDNDYFELKHCKIICRQFARLRSPKIRMNVCDCIQYNCTNAIIAYCPDGHPKNLVICEHLEIQLGPTGEILLPRRWILQLTDAKIVRYAI